MKYFFKKPIIIEVLLFIFFTTNLCSKTSIPGIPPREIEAAISKYKNKVKNCTYEIDYPVLKVKKKSSLYNEKNINAINDTIKKSLLNISAYDNEYDCNTKDRNAPEFSLNTTVEIKLLSERIYSIHIIESSYTAGNAHPNNIIRTYNFLLDEGREIKFRELFLGDAFRDTFDKLLAKDLVKQAIITSDPTEFDSVKKDEYNFYLTEKSINTVNLFDIHAMQGAEGKVSLDKMKKHLNKELLFKKKD